MGLTMGKILDRFSDGDIFSLTGKTSRYNFTISREEYEYKLRTLNDDEREEFF